MSTNTEVVVISPLVERAGEVEVHADEANALLVMADGYECTDIHTYETGVDAVQRMRQAMVSTMAFFAPMAEATNAAHKSVTGRRAEVTQPIQQAIGIVEGKVGAYRTEQKRIADQQAAAERRRLEAVERERREAEALEAASANDELDFQRAARMADAPVPLPPEVKAPEIIRHTAPKVKGMKETTTWEASFDAGADDGAGGCLDDHGALRALCLAVAEGRASVSFVEPVWGALRAYAKATAGTMPVPGIRLHQETKTTISKRRS